MIILKLILLQFFWLGAVKFSAHELSFLFWPLGIIILFLNYKVYKIKISYVRYLFFITLFSLWGVFQDGLLEVSGALIFKSNTFWLNSLWLVFFTYYGDVFNKMSRINILLQGLIGGAAGVFTYFAGCRLANVEIIDQQLFIIIVFISWFIFLPFTLFLFYKKNFWNWYLDRTVYFSFDKSGYLRHSEDFNDDIKVNLHNKKILVTGGTGGIGKSVCDTLSSLGTHVVFTGRNKDKGQDLSSINKTFIKMDMVNWENIKDFCENCEVFEGIVLNAGGMPDMLLLNDQGVEHQAASQLFGHYLLIELLRRNNKLNKGCRITWVSSGGMYFKKLDLNNLISPSNYDKVDTYANVKRAQITLVEELRKDNNWNDYSISTMHPGWVGTDGVKIAIPGFYKFTKNRLRSVEQGADTINWLQYTNEQIGTGNFYFDRKKVSPYISKKYIPTSEQRAQLLSMLKHYTEGLHHV
jgi:dehydrogenase/reductase SDR family protein 12